MNLGEKVVCRRRKIRILCNWLNAKEIATLWSRMSMSDKGDWISPLHGYHIQLDVSSPLDQIDYFIIINCTNEPFIRERSLLFYMEPLIDERETIWGEWSQPYKLVRYLFSHRYSLNIAEWHLSLTYHQLLQSSFAKDKIDKCSVIMSRKHFEQNHIRRIAFVDKLGEALGPDRFDGFGNLFQNPLPLYEKDVGLIPYRYHFNAECVTTRNYHTEKLYDAILSETLCFYHGDQIDFLPEGCYVPLKLQNLDEDIQTVVKAMNENWYEQRLPAILQAKQKILNELQFWPKITNIIVDLEKLSSY